MLIKFANASLLEARVAHQGDTLLRTAHRATFDYTPREGYLYVRSRAISSRTNDNYDSWPAEELRQAWATFIGKPVFVNHNNTDIRRKRGVIIDAALHEDIAPDGTQDTWIEVLHEIDAMRFPALAAAILAGDIERTSMGADVGESECSYCGNIATTPSTYCTHIARCKGQRLSRRNQDGSMEDVLVHEICRKISFFENSVLVEEPADPTAFMWGVDDRGLRSIGMVAKTAAIGRQIVYNDEKKRYELIEDGRCVRFSVSLDALKSKFPGAEVVSKKTAACNVLVDDMDVFGHITPQRPGILLQQRDGMSLVMFADNEQRMFPTATVVDVGPFWNGVGTVIASKTAVGMPPIEYMDGKDYNTGYRYLRASIRFDRDDPTKPYGIDVQAEEWGTNKWRVRWTIGPWETKDARGSYSDGDRLDDFIGPMGQLKPVINRALKAKYAEFVAGGMVRMATTKTAVVDEREAADKPCDHFEQDPEFGRGVCKNCLWAIGAHSMAAGGPDGHGGFGRYKLAYGETRAPSQVNTLGAGDCAVCGSEGSFDSTGRCTVCSYLPTPEPFRAPKLDVAQSVDMRDGWVNPELMSAPAFVSPDEQGDADPATPNPNPEPGGAVTGSIHPVSIATSPREEVGRHHEGATPMARPSQLVTASKDEIIARQAAEITRLRRAAGLDKAADVANPGQPVPEPSPQAAVLTDGVDDVPYNGEGGSGEMPSLEGVEPDATTTVMESGTALPDVAPDATTDVTAPVAGNTPSGDDYVVDTDPKAGTPSVTAPAFSGDGSWVQGSKPADIQARTYASLRLARLRIAAGIEKDDDITAAQKIAASKLTNESLRNEINTLTAVAAVRPAPTRRAPTQRGIPTLASASAPMLGTMPSMTPSDDEFLFT